MKCGEADGWDVRADRQGNNTIFEFYKFTPAGQDFYFTASMTGNSIDSLADNIEEYYEGFDPDYEASLWIEPDGHGQRGAPYHIKDISRHGRGGRNGVRVVESCQEDCMRQTVRKKPAVFLMDMAGLVMLQCKQVYFGNTQKCLINDG